MNEHIHPRQNHLSYATHRRQAWLQIFLPVLLAVALILLLALLTGLSAFGGTGDAPRWAAISTIWLLIPVMIFGLFFLLIFCGLVYLLARTLQVLPSYTSTAQSYVKRAASEIKRFSDMAAEPVLFVEEIKARIKAIFGQN